LTPVVAAPPRLLLLSGGLIHLVHQLAVVCSLPGLEAVGGGGASRDGWIDLDPLSAASPAPPAPVIAVLITGVLNRNPAALAALQDTIEPWFARLRREPAGPFAGLRLLRGPEDLPPGPWDLVCLNNQWQANQREWMETLEIPELLVCGDGLGLYYRCARELRALAPSLLGLPIREPGRTVRYALSGRQPRWHRPPLPSGPVPVATRQQLFQSLVTCLRPRAEAELEGCLQAWAPDRPLWLCSVPNLAHQFPDGRIAPAVLQGWRRHLERRHGFRRDRDRLLLIDHPKAPPDGSFGALRESWLAGPLRSAVPLEVFIALLQEARPDTPIRVCGMTSALYGVRHLTGAAVLCLSFGPLWRHNPGYRRQPLEFLHRSLRLARMALLTAQPGPMERD
jgi:hypothetical protein